MEDQAIGPGGHGSAAGSLQASTLEASLTVKDVSKSMNWYCEVLGFKVDQRHERNGALMAASLSAGTARIVIGQDDGARGVDRVKGEGFSLYLTTLQDIDVLAGDIKARGGELMSAPEDTPWGTRLFRVKDPDGFRFAISSPRAL